MPLPLAQVQELRDRLSDRFRPWSRSAQFWVRAVDIYGSYKVRAGMIGLLLFHRRLRSRERARCSVICLWAHRGVFCWLV